MSPTLTTGRVVIIGAGIAALSLALRLAPRPVLILAAEPLGQGASSAWAQGGVAAAMDPADSPAAHAEDTRRAGAGLVDPAIAELVTRAAPDHIRHLTQLGAGFDRAPDGGYVLSREAAHGTARVVRMMGDQAGAEIMRALVAAVRTTASVQVIEGVIASGLETAEGCVRGVRLMRNGGSEELSLLAPAVVLATGGAAGLYAITTNPPAITGQGLGMAARAGAVIADPEFVQFHPTAIDIGQDPAPLATEALRGEGGYLVDRNGERFMPSLHADAELAPRDVVARAIYAQHMQGLRPALDTRYCLGERIHAEFPVVAGACMRAGINPALAPIPVVAAAHYHMGGIRTDRDGRSSLPGLWACGEVASTGLHGANRLASNGLLEALVFAARCARAVAAALPMRDCDPVRLPRLATAPGPDDELVRRLRHAMSAGAGVVRDAAGLTECLKEIARIETAQPDCPILLNMTATARLIAAAALARRESRGAHCRRDFPDTNGTEGARTFMTLAEARRLHALCEEPA